MTAVLCVGAGGFIGAVFRYLLGLLPVSSAFPWATLGINFLGTVLIGVFTGLAERHGLSANTILFLKTGFCGGFTTFSTFSLELFSLLTKGQYTVGTLYATGSVLLCLAGVSIGLRVTNFFSF